MAFATSAHAQSGSTTKETDTTTATTADAEALAAELDESILGVWAFLTNRSLNRMQDQDLISANVLCRSQRRVSNPSYEKGAEQELPPEGNRRGSIVYYRTDKGLQRLDTSRRAVFLMTGIAKEILNNGRTVWTLSNSKAALKVGFGDMRFKGRTGPIMAEHNGFYLKCKSDS